MAIGRASGGAPTSTSGSAGPSWVRRGVQFSIGVALVAALIGLAVGAGRVLLLVFVGITLAAGLEPVIAWLRGRIGLGRGATILVVYGAFLVVVLGLALFVLPAAASQLLRAVDALPAFLDRIRDWAADLQPSALGAAIERLADAAERVIAPSSNGPTTGEVVEVGLTVVEVAVTVATLLTVVYYWLVEHARLQRYVLAFVPSDRRARVRDTWNEVETRLGLWVRGQLVLMAAIGVATGTACFLLGVPGALLLGLVSAVTEAIPLIGPILGAIPAVLLAATVSPELALIVAGVYAVLQLIEANVLVPIVMRNTIGISPFVVLLSLLIGGTVGGLTGALLAVPVAATIELVVQDLQARRKPVAQDPTAGLAAAETGDHAASGGAVADHAAAQGAAADPDDGRGGASVRDAPDAPADARDPIPPPDARDPVPPGWGPVTRDR